MERLFHCRNRRSISLFIRKAGITVNEKPKLKRGIEKSSRNNDCNRWCNRYRSLKSKTTIAFDVVRRQMVNYIESLSALANDILASNSQPPRIKIRGFPGYFH